MAGLLSPSQQEGVSGTAPRTSSSSSHSDRGWISSLRAREGRSPRTSPRSSPQGASTRSSEVPKPTKEHIDLRNRFLQAWRWQNAQREGRGGHTQYKAEVEGDAQPAEKKKNRKKRENLPYRSKKRGEDVFARPSWRPPGTNNSEKAGGKERMEGARVDIKQLALDVGKAKKGRGKRDESMNNLRIACCRTRDKSLALAERLKQCVRDVHHAEEGLNLGGRKHVNSVLDQLANSVHSAGNDLAFVQEDLHWVQAFLRRLESPRQDDEEALAKQSPPLPAPAEGKEEGAELQEEMKRLQSQLEEERKRKQALADEVDAQKKKEESVQEALKGLQEQLETAEARSHEKERQAEDAWKQVQDERQAKVAEIEAVQKEREALQEQLQEMSSQLDGWRGELQQVVEERDNLQAKLDGMQSGDMSGHQGEEREDGAEELRKKLVAAQDEAREWKEAASEAQEHVESVKRQYTAKQDELEKEKEEMQKELEAVRSAEEQKRRELQSGVDEDQALRQKVSELEREVSDLAQQKDAERHSREEVQSRAQRLEHEIAELTRAKEELEREKLREDDASVPASEARRPNDESLKEEKEEEQELSSLKEEKASLESEVRKEQERAEAALEDLRSAKDDQEAMRSRIEALHRENEEAEGVQKQQEEKIGRLEKDLQRASEAQESLAQELQAQKERAQQMSEEKEYLERESEANSAENRKEVERLKGELSSAEKRIEELYHEASRKQREKDELTERIRSSEAGEEREQVTSENKGAVQEVTNAMVSLRNECILAQKELMEGRASKAKPKQRIDSVVGQVQEQLDRLESLA